MESGKIEDTLLLNGPSQAFHFSPSVGRLNNDKAWYTRGNGQCLEIDLLELRHVLGIDTEGYQGILNHYVGTCEIKNSYDGITWVGYQDENNKKKDCSEALGVESGKISDTLGNGSSQVFDFSPSKGRLNSDKAWYTRGSGQCFEIDLQEVRHVLAIATQGYQGILDSYVGTFEIKNSYDGIIWLDYQDENKEKKQSFGGSNADTGTYDYFRWAFETRFLIYPKEYNRPWCKCLRVEVNGCSDCAVCSCFSEWPFFLKPITLTNGGHVETGSDNGCQGCHHVPGNAIYYNCLLENKWARTTSVTVTESVTITGKKDTRTNGDYSGFSGVIAVEYAVVFGVVLIVLVVFWKQKELKNSQQETKPAVRNPVVHNQIQMERPIEHVSTSNEEDMQTINKPRTY